MSYILEQARPRGFHFNTVICFGVAFLNIAIAAKSTRDWRCHPACDGFRDAIKYVQALAPLGTSRELNLAANLASCITFYFELGDSSLWNATQDDQLRNAFVGKHTHTCKTPACILQAKKYCQRCMLVAYCGKNCQTLHWPVHKPNCKQRTSVLQAASTIGASPSKLASVANDLSIGGPLESPTAIFLRYVYRKNLAKAFALRPTVDFFLICHNSRHDISSTLDIPEHACTRRCLMMSKAAPLFGKAMFDEGK